MLRKKHHRGSKAKVPIEHSNFYPYLVRYLEWLRVKAYSTGTLAVKDSRLRQFIQWCDERSLEDPRVITKPIIENYQRYLFYYRKANGHPLGLETQQVALSAVKTWFKWLTQENYLPSNPASEVQPVKKTKRLPERVLSVDEVHRILQSVDTETLAGIRLRAILEVLYSTGVRRSELCHLQINHVDLARGSLFVQQGKGAKDRYVPIGQRAMDWVKRYLDEVRPKLMITLNEQSLFLNDYGEQYRLSQLGDRVRKVLAGQGIEQGSCHLFRHAMATHMLENGADLRHIQLILGHSDINTTTVYTHLSMEKLRRIHEATHPAEQPVDK